MKQALYIAAGSLSLSLGVIGIFVPGLPTTPFLLLTAWLYIRSSAKLYSWLVNHRFLGGYIRAFSGGVTRQTKVKAVATTWIMVLISTFACTSSWSIRLVILAGGLIGTLVMVRLKEPGNS